MLRCIISDRRRNRESSREKVCTTFAPTATASSAWCGIATRSKASVPRNASTSIGNGFKRRPISAEAGWIPCGRQASTRRPTPTSNQRLSRLRDPIGSNAIVVADLLAAGAVGPVPTLVLAVFGCALELLLADVDLVTFELGVVSRTMRGGFGVPLLRSRSEHPPRFLVGQQTPGRRERVDKARQLLAQT